MAVKSADIKPRSRSSWGMAQEEAGRSFPVTVEGILAFVATPRDALNAIVDWLAEGGDVNEAVQNEGLAFAFTHRDLEYNLIVTPNRPSVAIEPED